MLAQRLSRRAAAAAPRAGVRALATTASMHIRTPSMGDINPSPASIEQFNEKQRAFREQLVEAQRERGARAFGSQTLHDSDTPNQSSSQTAAGATADANSSAPDRKQGPLTNLIYGTKEGREMEAQMEASFSQVLARGKYVHSIVFHEVKPDKVDEYIQLTGEFYPKMANTPENKVHLVGSWRTEVGDCDTFGRKSLTHNSILLPLLANTTTYSSYLGVPAIRGLPRISTLHLSPSCLQGFQHEAQQTDQF